MNIKELHATKTWGSIDYERTDSFVSGWLAAKFEGSLNQLPDAKVYINYTGIYCYPKTREECVQMIKVFGGKWTKQPEDLYQDKIRYSQPIANPFEEDWQLIISQAPPPPSCQIVEVEELVPASVRKVKKIVCPKPTTDDEETVTEAAPLPPEQEAANV